MIRCFSRCNLQSTSIEFVIVSDLSCEYVFFCKKIGNRQIEVGLKVVRSGVIAVAVYVYLGLSHFKVSS